MIYTVHQSTVPFIDSLHFRLATSVILFCACPLNCSQTLIFQTGWSHSLCVCVCVRAHICLRVVCHLESNWKSF